MGSKIKPWYYVTGEVLLWDLSREDDMLIATSGLGDDAHQEPVSKVYWITDAKGKKIYVRYKSILHFSTGLGSAVVEHPPMVREVPGSIPGVESYQIL